MLALALNSEAKTLTPNPEIFAPYPTGEVTCGVGAAHILSRSTRPTTPSVSPASLNRIPRPTPYILHPTPVTPPPRPTPYTPHSTPYTPHSTPCTLHTTHYPLHTAPNTIHHNTPYTLHPASCALHPTLYALHAHLIVHHAGAVCPRIELGSRFTRRGSSAPSH